MSDTCEFCNAPFRGSPGKGRPRKYCTDACRQAAHRRRLHAGSVSVKATARPSQPAAAAEQPPALRGRPAGPGPSAGDELLTEIARDIQDGARDLARLLSSLDGEEPLRRIAQLHEQLDGLTAAVVGRARYRRVTWATISSILGISEDTARHRFTERHVLRRLARFHRSDTALLSLARLFTAPATASHDAAVGSDGAEPGDTGGDRSESPDQQTSPSASLRSAYNRLSPVLSMLLRSAQLTNKDISSRIGCSPSYMSRILSGERVPTWDLTRRFAQTCGADPEVLRTVWESEKLRSRTAATTPEPEPPAQTAAEQLRSAIHTLHLRAGRPSPCDIAVASRWLLPASAVSALLESTVLPPREVLLTFVRLLGGSTSHFSGLLDNAHQAVRNTTLPRDPAPSSQPTTPPPAEPATSHPTGPDAVIKTFSKVLTEDHTVEDGRARLLHKLARHPADSPHRRPRPLTQALRQRLLPPPTTITPLGGT